MTVSRAPITISITVTFIFHCFFSSLARFRYLSFFSLSFNYTPWSARTAKSTIRQVLFFYWLSLGLVFWPRLIDPREFCVPHSVICWPLTEPSIKRCICANKRKKKQKRKQVGVMKEYRQVPVVVEFVGDRKTRVKASLQPEVCGPRRPPVEQPQPRCGRSAAMVRRRSWVNIAVCPCLHSSLTHHRNIENNVWEIHIFYREVYSLVHWSSSIMFDYVSTLYMYTHSIQQCSRTVRSRYFFLFGLSFSFTLWSARTVKSTIRPVLSFFFFFFFFWLSVSLVVWPRFGDPKF